METYIVAYGVGLYFSALIFCAYLLALAIWCQEFHLEGCRCYSRRSGVISQRDLLGLLGWPITVPVAIVTQVARPVVFLFELFAVNIGIACSWLRRASTKQVSFAKLSLKDATCRVCGEAFKGQASVCACDACGTPHHEDCWEYNGGCSVYACRPTYLERRAVNLPSS